MDNPFAMCCSLFDQKESFALVTILTRLGSAPRTAGTRMLVRRTGGVAGTIGGGQLEAEAEALARQVLRDRQPVVKRFALTAGAKSTMDMICGGEVELLVDYVDAGEAAACGVYRAAAACAASGDQAWLLTPVPGREEIRQRRICLLHADGRLTGRWEGNTEELQELAARVRGRYPVVLAGQEGRWLVEPICNNGTVFLFGCGHISQQLALLTALAGFRTVVLDDRAQYASRERFAMADEVIVLDDFARASERVRIDPNSYVVILTRGHLHDSTVLAQVIGSEAAYVGMIGSRTKRDAIYAQMRADGVTEEALARVHAPVGLNIGAESPEEVAISIVAELIQARSQRA